MEFDPNYLKDKLREFRREIGMSQEEIAKRSGMKQSSYSKYETAQIKRPKKEVVQRFADILGHSLKEFYLDKDDDFLPSEIRMFLQNPNCMPYVMKAYSKFYEDMAFGKIDSQGNKL